MIFKRIESYLTYRLCSSFIFGITFTLIYVASAYNFPTWTLILMSLLNDFAVSSSSKDQVVIQREPVSLNMYKVATTALVMAIISSLEIWGLTMSLLKYEGGEGHFWGLTPEDERDGFTGCEVAAFVFLSLIITIQLNLLVARSPKPFFLLKTGKDESGYFTAVPPPSIHVLGSIGLSLTIATFIAVYWDDSITLGSGFGMQGMGWKNAGLVWCWALLWFVVIDLAKFAVLTIWKALEKDHDGRTFFRNVLELGAMAQESPAAKAARVTSMQKSLGQFDDAASKELSLSASVRAGSLTSALALLAPPSDRTTTDVDSGKMITPQEAILAAETLQNDPNLMRIVSHLCFEMAQMQERLNEMESRNVNDKKSN